MTKGAADVVLSKPASPRRFSIGVTGHRPNQLPEGEIPRLRRALEDAMDAIAAAAGEAQGAPVRVTLVSALAEGADRFAAHAALARNWTLVSPLPFREARYLEDFETEASKAEFKALLRKASVLEPEGAEGYLRVGEMIMERSEILLALWNGAEPKGPGGTGDVAARALMRGMPVLWLPVEASPVRLIAPTRRPRAKSFQARVLAALETRFARHTQPPAMRLAAT